MSPSAAGSRPDSALSLERARIAVIGLGLMGGSFALALRDRVAALYGVDPDDDVRRRALQRNIVDRAEPSPSELVAAADIVVLAAPVRANLALLDQLALELADGALLFDLSSTKRAIVHAMDALPSHLRAVGGHPMCGKERDGLDHADGALFRGQHFALCPTARSDELALATARSLVDAVGAIALTIGAGAHDAAVARTSHLPYLLAVALMSIYEQLDPPRDALAGTGFRDTSRLAASAASMIADVLATNRDEVIAALDEAQRALAELCRLVESSDTNALADRLHAAQRARRSWEQRG